MNNKELINNYITYKKIENCTEGTLKNIETMLTKLSNDIGKPFSEATEKDIIKTLGKYKPSTMRVKILLYRSFYRHILNMDQNETPTIFKRIKIPSTKTDNINYRDRIISPEEYDLLLRNASPKHKAILETLYKFGIRKSELIHLNTGDLIYDGKFTTITVRESKTETRDIITYGRCKHLLMWYENFHSQTEIKSNPLFYPSEKNNKKRYSKAGIGKLVERIGIKSKIRKKITPHDFRHTFITRKLQETKPTNVMTLAGLSKNSKVLAIYDHNKIDDYKKELLTKNNHAKPTYEFLEKQKNKLEENYKQEISVLKNELNDLKKMVESMNDITLDEFVKQTGDKNI